MTVEDEKNQKEAVDEQEGDVSVHSSFCDDESSKQGQSPAKESRQELSKWKIMKTVGKT